MTVCDEDNVIRAFCKKKKKKRMTYFKIFQLIEIEFDCVKDRYLNRG